MIKSTSVTCTVLRAAGLRCTAARLHVLEVLRSLHTPLSVDELNAHVHTVHRVTLYRMLEQFAKRGLVERVMQHDGVRRYEYQHEHHHHITCTACGTRARVQVPERVLGGAAVPEGFAAITSHSLEFYGTCRSCSRPSGTSGA